MTVFDRHAGAKPMSCVGGAQLSIDLSKAFDLLPKRVLCQLLQDTDLSRDEHQILLEWHQAGQYRIQGRGSDKKLSLSNWAAESGKAVSFPPPFGAYSPGAYSSILMRPMGRAGQPIEALSLPMICTFSGSSKRRLNCTTSGPRSSTSFGCCVPLGCRPTLTKAPSLSMLAATRLVSG